MHAIGLLTKLFPSPLFFHSNTLVHVHGCAYQEQVFPRATVNTLSQPTVYATFWDADQKEFFSCSKSAARN